MDFGSSHVFAGAPYYDDVPNEDTEPASKSQPGTIYEAVNETNEEHTYDPVAFSSPDIERREYDLVPYEPELDTTGMDQSSARHSQPKRSFSSSVFRKAKHISVFKQKKKPYRSASSVSELDEALPTLPPTRRSIQNKPLPPIPGPPERISHQMKPLPPIPNTETTAPTGPPPRIPPKPVSFRSPSTTQKNSVDDIFSSPYNVAQEPLSEPLKPSTITPKPLYPSLENVYSHVPKDGNQQRIAASAPPLDVMVMNPVKCFDLISFDEPVVGENNGQYSDYSKSPHFVGLRAETRETTPSAPKLSSSMVKRETREKNAPKNQYAAADTNVVSVKLGILESTANTMLWAMPPVRCTFCQAVLLHSARDQESSTQCRFCGNNNKNITEAVLPLVGNESDITYVLCQDSPVLTDDPIIVFCIDTSGSMCVTSEVQGSTVGACFMSRLQAVQYGIIEQLNRLKQTKPKARVAIVTFSNMVVLLGDGSQSQYMALNDAQLYDTDYIQAAVSNAVLPGFIGQTHAQLCRTVNMLKEHGGTALGPALFLSVALASKKCGSQVIVCTDGRANVGIGSLELESDYKMCHNFYTETSDYGTHRGTMVSILSIEGTDCRLVELGKVADRTAGKVKIANIQNLGAEFNDILSSALMATQVDVRIATQKEVYFHESTEHCNSLVTSFVGNATQDTEITFKYGILESDQSLPPQNALFQLQIRYQMPNGCTCLRAITQLRPVTENRMLAEQGLNPAVVGTYASQLASKLVLDGDLHDAKLTTDAHKKLINRAMSIRSTASNSRAYDISDERIYGSVCHHMDELNQEIKRVVESVRPSPSPTPPPLPPRLSETPTSSLSRSSSVLSLTLPDAPNNPLATKEKMMDAVEHCTDEVARKLYKHRNACGKMFAAC